MTNIVKLNVGGTIYITTKTTLLSVPDSYFGVLLSSNFKPTLIEDAFFIDRSGILFEHILNYLRTQPLQNESPYRYQLPNDENLLKSLLLEADFYLLSELREDINLKLSTADKKIKNVFYIQNIDVPVCSPSTPSKIMFKLIKHQKKYNNLSFDYLLKTVYKNGYRLILKEHEYIENRNDDSLPMNVRYIFEEY